MLAKLRKTSQEDEGFTLIELLVVIIIIGILAAIAIPVFLNQRKKATEASVKSDLKTIANQMETYYVDNQSYPAVASSVTPGSVTVGGVVVTLSKGNVAMAGATAPGSYCIGAANSDDMASVYWYSSDKGGVLPKGTNCT